MLLASRSLLSSGDQICALHLHPSKPPQIGSVSLRQASYSVACILSTMASWKALSTAMQELRIHICQSSAASKGARDFVMGSYAEMKKANSDFPILVREAAGTEAKLIARYDFGQEKAVSVQGLDAAAVQNKLKELISAGEAMPKSGE